MRPLTDRGRRSDRPQAPSAGRLRARGGDGGDRPQNSSDKFVCRYRIEVPKFVVSGPYASFITVRGSVRLSSRNSDVKSSSYQPAGPKKNGSPARKGPISKPKCRRQYEPGVAGPASSLPVGRCLLGRKKKLNTIKLFPEGSVSPQITRRKGRLG